MDDYRESIRPQTGGSSLDRRGSVDQSPPPTLAEVARWKEESARFLHDVREQLNEILAEVDRTLTDNFATANDSCTPPTDTYDDRMESRPETEPQSTEPQSTEPQSTEPQSDERISALKARLASKIHTFEETNDRSHQDTPGWEAGK